MIIVKVRYKSEGGWVRGYGRPQAPMHPLYQKHSGESEARPAYVVFWVQSGEVHAEWEISTSDDIPDHVWNGSLLRWPVDNEMTLGGLITFIASCCL